MKTTNLEPYRRLLKRLVELRKEAECSQTELARRLGTRQSYVSNVETGERRLDLVEYVRWTLALKIEPTGLIAQLASDYGSLGPGGRRKPRLKMDGDAS